MSARGAVPEHYVCVSGALIDITRPQSAADQLPVDTLGRLAHRFRIRADSYLADARQRPSEHEAVIRLSAMASTLNGAATQRNFPSQKSAGRGERKRL